MYVLLYVWCVRCACVHVCMCVVCGMCGMCNVLHTNAQVWLSFFLSSSRLSSGTWTLGHARAPHWSGPWTKWHANPILEGTKVCDAARQFHGDPSNPRQVRRHL
jgi:hypothetical protein